MVLFLGCFLIYLLSYFFPLTLIFAQEGQNIETLPPFHSHTSARFTSIVFFVPCHPYFPSGLLSLFLFLCAVSVSCTSLSLAPF